MKIHLENAVQNFYSNPSLEQVYQEAVANALDAGASEIGIHIKVVGYDEPKSLEIQISDNGHGFTDASFDRFCTLLDPRDRQHKGVGRLVFLAYFDTVEVTSAYEPSAQRHFVYTSYFDDVCELSSTETHQNRTVLHFKKFNGERIKSYKYIRPSSVKENLLSHFFPTFFELKRNGKSLTIKISVDTQKPNQEQDFFSTSVVLSLDDIPELIEKTVTLPSVDLLEPIKIYYAIGQDYTKPKNITSAICIDGRTQDYPLVDIKNIPAGYQVLFLFASNLFIGTTDVTRREIDPSKFDDKSYKPALREVVGSLLNEAIPEIERHNEVIQADLHHRYPHLEGYFPGQSIGLMVRDEQIEEAQRKFFDDQKQVLECNELDDTRYQQALRVSARVLLEYILYRDRIIKALKSKSTWHSEDEIHNVIVPKRTIYRSQTVSSDIYNNNIWLLDDKYMSYSIVLSDQAMDELIKVIDDSEDGDDTRPDIAIVFSADPALSTKFDVVIVELKKHGVALAKKEEVISQLKQRARRLLKHYPNRINRIWFYGVTDIDDEFRLSLKEQEYRQLFSHGQLYYRSQPIYLEVDGEAINVDMFVMTYDALINDAEVRNEAFLGILKKSIRDISEE